MDPIAVPCFRSCRCPRRDTVGGNPIPRHPRAVRAENQLLEQQIAALGSIAGVERLAREQFGLVYDGEVSYVVETITVEPAAVAPPLSMDESAPWYAKVWNYLTGRDLVPDEQS